MEAWEKQYQVLAETLAVHGVDVEGLKAGIKKLVVELPSWAVGNSGPRYGVFRQPGPLEPSGRR